MTETERLRAVAKRYQSEAKYAASTDCTPLADMFDGVADRHTPLSGQADNEVCERCDPLQDWPCPDVRAALAVADALGVEQ